MTLSAVGQSVVRRDLREKLTGEARYSADLKLPGMLYGQILRSPHPHANILSMDTIRASQLPGVHAIVTPFNAPPGRVASDLLILDTRVRFVGDEVAAIAAADLDVARQALELIQVEYEVLPFILEPEEALKPDAIAIHPQGNLAIGRPLSLERGDAAQGFAEADLIFEEEYDIPTHSATPLEPRAALASWEGDFLTVWKSSRGVHVDQAALAGALDIPQERIRVVGPYLGAGYGNKDESRLAALAAVLARRAGRPVRIEYSRQEEFVAGRTRHAARIKLKIGVKQDGSVTAIHGIATFNAGAYQASTPGVARRTGQGMLYLYRCPNVKYEAYPAYTNRPVAGSYRALGAPQGHFALETLMDQVAETLGLDPLEFRLKNQVPPEGQPGRRTSPPEQIIDSQPLEGGIPFSSNGLDECLRRGAEAFGWNQQFDHAVPGEPSKRRGRGLSIMIYRGGPGSVSSAQVRIDKSGQVTLITGLMDVGEGASTVLVQMAADALGVNYEDVSAVFADTAVTPDAPITAGSTATFSTGTAVVEAATQVRQQLLELASDGLEAPIQELEAGEGLVWVKSDPARRMSIADVASRIEGDFLSASSTITPGSADYIVNSFGAHFAEVEVDTDTGRVRVLRYVAAHDSGRIVNPQTALNQVEGGISQMLGFALSEELVTDGPTGVTLNASYLEHKSPTILDYPDIQVIFADVIDPVGPLGAKALGEVPSVGVAPAIANAIYDAIGVRFKQLPMTPDKVIQALSFVDEGRKTEDEGN
jgi:CO/xanthine dehydrogenase Mo-binding subunit